MDVLTGPDTATTTRTSPRSRPRRWPANDDVAARRRSAGHDDGHASGAAGSTTESRVTAAVEAPAVRRGIRVLHCDHPTALDRARSGLVAALLAAAVAVAGAPMARGNAADLQTRRAAVPAVTPTATTTPCSPIAVDCCPGTTALIEILRDIRPTCP